METPDLIFERLKVCILVPTFNNAKTLVAVLTDLEPYQPHIIVVNDGSTDNTESILSQFPGIHVVQYSPNLGKGYALRTGFRTAREKGYDYAISIDSDGQHFICLLYTSDAADEEDS